MQSIVLKNCPLVKAYSFVHLGAFDISLGKFKESPGDDIPIAVSLAFVQESTDAQIIHNRATPERNLYIYLKKEG